MCTVTSNGIVLTISMATVNYSYWDVALENFARELGAWCLYASRAKYLV